MSHQNVARKSAALFKGTVLLRNAFWLGVNSPILNAASKGVDASFVACVLTAMSSKAVVSFSIAKTRQHHAGKEMMVLGHSQSPTVIEQERLSRPYQLHKYDRHQTKF
jgi:hypothetical protein